MSKCIKRFSKKCPPTSVFLTELSPRQETVRNTIMRKPVYRKVGSRLVVTIPVSRFNSKITVLKKEFSFEILIDNDAYILATDRWGVSPSVNWKPKKSFLPAFSPRFHTNGSQARRKWTYYRTNASVVITAFNILKIKKLLNI